MIALRYFSNLGPFGAQTIILQWCDIFIYTIELVESWSRGELSRCTQLEPKQSDPGEAKDGLDKFLCRGEAQRSSRFEGFPISNGHSFKTGGPWTLFDLKATQEQTTIHNITICWHLRWIISEVDPWLTKKRWGAWGGSVPFREAWEEPRHDGHDAGWGGWLEKRSGSKTWRTSTGQ